MQPQIHQTLDHLFRHEYGRIIAGLVNRFGTSKLELIEDAVQEALLKAMQLWGFDKVPDNPTSWLFTVARNKLIDTLRKQNRNRAFEPQFLEASTESETFLETEIQDEQLKMIFACCNPALGTRDSLLLSLKLIGGFSVTEIARALLMKPEAAKKSLQRARQKFREVIGQLYVPTGSELKGYLDRVLKVIYLIFNEGYKVSKGEDLINQDLCGEALRLSLLLSANSNFTDSRIYSLLSLMSFKVSRFHARIQNGELITFEFQNRETWLPEYIEWGFYYFHRATISHEKSNYYLEAAIEYQYHISKNYESVDWSSILMIYDALLKRAYSPILELNKWIIYAQKEKTVSILPQLNQLEENLSTNHLFYAFRSDMLAREHRNKEARQNLEKAIELTQNSIEQNYLLKKLNGLNGKGV